MSPDQVLDEVKKANLRGRGGGGFPAGSKWETTRNAPEKTKYVIVNGHEGESAAFMDRAMLTGNPHKVLEGLIIGAYAIGAQQGFMYTRHDMPLLTKHVRAALAQAEEYGLLGENILGSGFDFDVELHFDVGIFVSGESSALMRSIEGNPPEPRPKYIRTSVSGIWDKPSNLNNVETWANVPQIISRGAEWFTSIGSEGSKGTKLISLSGHVVNSGVVEVPMGTPLRTLVFDIGGGVRDGKTLKAIHFGGAMGGSIPADLIDAPARLRRDVQARRADRRRRPAADGRGHRHGRGGALPARLPRQRVLRQVRALPRGHAADAAHPDQLTQGKGRQGDLERLEDLAEVTGTGQSVRAGEDFCRPAEEHVPLFQARDTSRAFRGGSGGK